MANFNIENNHEYVAEVSAWVARFNVLLATEMYAAMAIVAYYLPKQCVMACCPLGDLEYQSMGEAMRSNPAMLAAAGETGLLADGIDRLFYAALSDFDNWCYYASDIKYILENDELRRYVSFQDRCFAESFFSGGSVLKEDEDLWSKYYDVVEQRLNQRKTRGFAY